MLYIDPTEARTDTRLPSDVIDIATELPSLERVTGADLLITTATGKVDVSNPDMLPVRLWLEKACRTGMLVQRKSGSDFLNSIPTLHDYQVRMLQWGRPGGVWLLVTGVRFDGGTVIADGRRSGYDVKTVSAAVTWWKFRGGHVEFLSGDGDILSWVTQMFGYVRKASELPSVCVLNEDTSEDHDAYLTFVKKRGLQELNPGLLTWLDTGRAFPKGIGYSHREALALSLLDDNVVPTLEHAILRACGQVKVKGFGPALTKRCQVWFSGPFETEETE